MMGSTNGPHLNSFSLVDIVSHGKAVAVMLPYYVVFFAPAIEGKLIKLASIVGRDIGGKLAKSYPVNKGARVLGEFVAEGIIEFYK